MSERGCRLKSRPPISNPGRPGTLLVPLTRGYFAVIDERDGEAVGKHNWIVDIRKSRRAIYAQTPARLPNGTRTSISLHRFLWSLWGAPPTPEIDHENTDGLDCTRLNLRSATIVQNRHNVPKRKTNTSGCKGVYWHRRLGKWFAQITVDGKQSHLGVFGTKVEAAEAYSIAARASVGQFARLT